MNDFLTTRHPRRGPVLAGIGALVILAVLVLALVLIGRGGAFDSAGPTATAPASPATSTPAATASVTATSGSLRLVAGTKRVAGIWVGFPHTTAGAVSAAVEFTSASATLDPDRAAAVGRLIADPSWTTAPDDFAAGAATSRRDLGLPASGDIGSDSSVVMEPTQYQLRGGGQDQLTVLLLTYLTTTSPTKGSETSAIVLPCPMRWTGTDWRIEQAGSTDYSDLGERPGTSEAAQAGWLDFRR